MIPNMNPLANNKNNTQNNIAKGNNPEDRYLGMSFYSILDFYLDFDCFIFLKLIFQDCNGNLGCIAICEVIDKVCNNKKQ